MRKLITYTMLAGSLGLAGCELDVNNPNSPTVEGATSDPRAIDLFAQGVQVAVRNNRGGDPSPFGIFGRESFNYFLTDSRTTSGFLITPQDANSFSAGVRWGGSYGALRDIFNFTELVNQSTALTATQKSAALGWAETWDAHEYFFLVLTRHNLGGAIGISANAQQIFPFVTRDSVYRYVTAKLDAAYTKLQAGGTAFPFSMNAGFASFNTPATFAQFNRGLAAKVLVHRATLGCGNACYTQALTALGSSFIGASANLGFGANAIHSLAAGDTQNGISAENTDIRAHPSLIADAEAGDSRRGKITNCPARTPPGGVGITSDKCFTIYPNRSSSIPFLNVGELVLLRAEARWFTGDKTGAIADLNTIRAGASLGNTAVTAGSTDAQFVDALLYERKMELMYTGNRWFDVRRFNRLNTLPLDLPTHVRAEQIVVPQAECLSRARTGDASLAGPGCP